MRERSEDGAWRPEVEQGLARPVFLSHGDFVS